MTNPTKTILIVEDNEKNMRLIGDVLRMSGYQTLEALNGREGIAMAIEAKPDLIIMDIQMPVMDGIEATRTPKNDPGTKNIPVLALTSYAMKGDKERMMAVGFNGYLSKPFNITEFLATVARYDR